MRKGEVLVRGLEALRVWREAFEKLGRADGNDERYDRDFWDDTIARVEAWGKQQEVVGELAEPITIGRSEESDSRIAEGKGARGGRGGK